MVLSVSHDIYCQNCGGIQNVIADEQLYCTKSGWTYLHISPMQPVAKLADDVPASEFYVNIVLDGVFLGCSNLESILVVLKNLRDGNCSIQMIVHHMMGFAPESLQQLASAGACRNVVVWAHDFFTLCPSYNLLRNGVAFCGAPSPASPSCGICSYIGQRQIYMRRFAGFFAATTPIVMAPSEAALEIWKKSTELPFSEAITCPLARPILAPAKVPYAPATPEHPLRVAHLGGREFHKGWPIFEALALALKDDPRYALFQFGIPDGPAMPASIHQVPVRVTPQERAAMITALAEWNIDVVVNWSPWPETFCFTACEALAAGAFLVTNPGTGNVPNFIRNYAPQQGWVVADENELLSIFRRGQLVEKVASSPRSRGALLLGNGTIDWLRWNRWSLTPGSGNDLVGES